MATTVVLLLMSAVLMNVSTMRSSMPPPHWLDVAMNILEKFLPFYRVGKAEKLGDPTAGEGHEMKPEAAQNKDGGFSYFGPLARAIKLLLFVLSLAVYLLVAFCHLLL